MSKKEIFIRAYLRASTKEQDAERAKQTLIDFVSKYDMRISKFYIENVSGAKLDRPELFQLIEDSYENDVLLVEEIDRLTRLKKDDWNKLKGILLSKGIRVVAVNIPTSHLSLLETQIFSETNSEEDTTSRVMDSINNLMIDFMAAFAHNEYTKNRRRQAEGIAKAKAKRVYTGKKPNYKRYETILKLVDSGTFSKDIVAELGCSYSTINSAKVWRYKSVCELLNQEMTHEYIMDTVSCNQETINKAIAWQVKERLKKGDYLKDCVDTT